MPFIMMKCFFNDSDTEVRMRKMRLPWRAFELKEYGGMRIPNTSRYLPVV